MLSPQGSNNVVIPVTNIPPKFLLLLRNNCNTIWLTKDCIREKCSTTHTFYGATHLFMAQGAELKGAERGYRGEVVNPTYNDVEILLHYRISIHIPFSFSYNYLSFVVTYRYVRQFII